MGKHYPKVFTDEMIQFIRDNAEGTPIKNITVMLNDMFGTDVSRHQVYIAMKNRKIKNGIDPKFKAGVTGPTKGMKFPGRRGPRHKP